MTAKQIANGTGVHARTIQRIAAELFPAMVRTNRATMYSHEETEQILMRLRIKGATFAAKVQERARQNVAPAVPERDEMSRQPKLPTGAQLHELRMIYGPAAAWRRVDYILGYAPPMEIKEEKASLAEAESLFRKLEAIAERGPDQLSLGLKAPR
jgi:hypothetical protein